MQFLFDFVHKKQGVEKTFSGFFRRFLRHAIPYCDLGGYCDSIKSFLLLLHPARPAHRGDARGLVQVGKRSVQYGTQQKCGDVCALDGAGLAIDNVDHTGRWSDTESTGAHDAVPEGSTCDIES